MTSLTLHGTYIFSFSIICLIFSYIFVVLSFISVELLAAGGFIVFTWPLFDLLWHPSLSVPLFGQVCFAIMIALFDGVAPVTAAEAFPSHVRCTAVAISHNLCKALLGGTSPMAATYLIDKTYNEMAPAVYLR